MPHVIRRLMGPALLVVLAMLPLAVATPAQADGTLRPGHCSSPYVHQWGRGPVRQTSAGFTQQLLSNYCYDASQVTFGAIEVHPLPGYQGSHVKGCSVHIGLVDDDTGWHQDRAYTCTAQAQTGKPWSLAATEGWELPLDLHYYHMTGYVNLESAVYHSTYAQASRYLFRW